VSELLSTLESLRAHDTHTVPETTLLDQAEELLQAKKVLDGLLADRLQALDARDVTVTERARVTRSWLVEDHQLGHHEATRRVWVARRLAVYPLIAAALLAGDITHDNAYVIMSCLAKLPAGWQDTSQAQLVAFAAEHDPGMTAALCRDLRVLSGADDDADAAEQAKYASRWVKLDTTFDGMTSLTGMLDPASAATVRTALDAITSRDTRSASRTEDDRTTGQRTADALTELASMALGYTDLPDTGGERPTVVVTIPLAELRDSVPPGQLSTATLNGHQIGPGTARMLACDAGVIPAVLGGKSEVLDLGRKQRTWSIAQRRAARLRDRGCTWPKCQATLDRCALHHQDFWARDHGRTDYNKSLHLCPFHHWLVHHSTWTIKRNDHGHIEVSRT
jgi:hypothetical protein